MSGRWWLFPEHGAVYADEVMSDDGKELAHPVVVIDPEDSRGAAVEIVQVACSALNVMPGRDISAGIKAAQDAIARLADPTPPVLDFDLTPAVRRAVEHRLPVVIGGILYRPEGVTS